MAGQQIKRRGGRPPKYDWDDKREICYKLYVEEKKSADKIIKYFTEHFQVETSELPCRKGFLRQFQVWGFPSHRQKLCPEDEARATARIRDLWAQNVSQKDIKQQLDDEGFDLGNHVFNLLWKKNGFRRRNDQGYKAPGSSTTRKRKQDDVESDEFSHQNFPETLLSTNQPWPTVQPPGVPSAAAENVAITAEDASIRAQRLYELQIDSDQKLQSGKRRRRIRGYAHLPPDTPGSAPRYASETSLDECKAYLHLSNEMYTTIRADYDAICRELGIVKKTQCEEGMWEESKNRLVRENLHLSAMLHPLQPDQDKKALALDCICADVTKRIRASGRLITIAEANNCLDLNPMESKAVRRSLYEILGSHNFESRLMLGEQRWAELRQQWLNTSQKLQQATLDGDPKRAKCVDVLCSDTMKRYRDDKIRRGERTVARHDSSYGPGPGPARPTHAKSTDRAEMEDTTTQPQYPIRAPIREPRVRAAVEGKGYYAHPSGNLLMSLAQATGAISFDIDPALEHTMPSSVHNSPCMPFDHPISAYFYLAPDSHIIGNHPRMWLGRLQLGTIESLYQAATSKAGAAQVAKIHGLLKNSDGVEDSWLIETDEELGVYLQESGEKAKFSVLLQGGYA